MDLARVLAPGGRFGLSDLTCNGALPADLDGLLGWIACIADAQPISSCVADLETVGLKVNHIESQDEALSTLINLVRDRLLAAEFLTKLQQVDFRRDVDLQMAKGLGRSAAKAVEAGTPGYALIIATKPLP